MHLRSPDSDGLTREHRMTLTFDSTVGEWFLEESEPVTFFDHVW